MCEASLRTSSARIVLRYWLATLIASTLLGLPPLGSIARPPRPLHPPHPTGCPDSWKGRFPHKDYGYRILAGLSSRINVGFCGGGTDGKRDGRAMRRRGR